MLSTKQTDMQFYVETPKNIIVDCDASTDNVMALIILLAAHKKKKICVKAVTCVNGNTTVNKVVKNIFKTLEVCGITDVPVYRGASSFLLETKNTKRTVIEYYHHGFDGFGDVFSKKIDTSKLQKDHAVYALHKITAEDPGNVAVVCLGPLTNVAMTIKMYPKFLSNVKEFFVIGGNSTGQGNIKSAYAEFNFYMDPESVHIVLNSNDKPFWLLPWEACLSSWIKHEWRRNVLGKIDVPCVHLLNNIERNRRANKELNYYIMFGAFLAGIIIKPVIAKRIEPRHVDIELHDDKTRGEIIFDHLLIKKPNVNLINSFDSELFKKVLISAVNVFTKAQ